jgi:hypothetical protein
MENGAGEKHWVLVIAHGVRFIGRLHGRSSEHKTFTLRPVLEVQVEDGAIKGLRAIFGLVSIEEMTFPDDVITVPTSDLNQDERTKLLAGANGFVEMLIKARKGASRLVI